MDSSSGTSLMRVVDWIYGAITSGSVELAESYIRKNGGDREKSIDDLVRWHICYAGLVGFTTGFGGALNAAVVAPLNISSVIAIQLRMIGAIAHLRGYALTDPKVKTMVLLCLTGSGVTAILQDLGFSIGGRVRKGVIGTTSKAAAKNFDAVLGRYLTARIAKTKATPSIAPLVNGIVGSLFDAGITHGIGSTARLVFKPSAPRLPLIAAPLALTA